MLHPRAGPGTASGMTATGGLKPEDVGIGALFWCVPDAVVVADVDSGCIVLWSPSAERIFGYPASAVIGHRVEETIIPERLRGAHAAGLTRFERTGHGTLIDASTPFEVPAQCADGSEIPVELTLSHIDAPNGARYVLALIRDSRARKEVEEQRVRAATAERSVSLGRRA